MLQDPQETSPRGEEIDSSVTEGLLDSPKLGDKTFQEFLTERLVKGTVDFYNPIKKVMLTTGLQRKTKVPKMVTVLKQDYQAFGSLLSKSVSLEEAF